MHEAVDERGGELDVAEDLAPFRDAEVGGQDRRGLLAAGLQQIEAEVRVFGPPDRPLK